MDETARPTIELARRVGVDPLNRAREVGHFVRVIGERIEARAVLEQNLRSAERGVFQRHIALDPKPTRLAGKTRDRHAIVEDVVNPAQAMGRAGRFRASSVSSR